LNSCICIYIICKCIFLMIKCSCDVKILFIFVIYDVQYVTTTYGLEKNWISAFANHKWTTCILNALRFMLLEFRFKKMYDFVNLLLKLNIYVLSSRIKEFRYLKHDISPFSLKFFKDWNILFACVWRYYCENG